MSFEELGLLAPLLRAVTDEGYTIPTPIQSQAIPQAMAGRDLLGCAQTGTGKTAAFALPLLHRLTHAGNPPKGHGRRIRALVLSPTRELAGQIGESFRIYGQYTALRQTVVYGGVGQNPQTRAIKHGIDILVATPGRLIDLMNQGYIDLSHVEIFVLDEADRMLDMGFLPDVKHIISELPAHRQTLMFSATMPEPIARLANAILRDPARIRIAPVKATAELIEHSVYFVPHRQKSRLLASFLHSRAFTRALVFTRTKRGADKVSKHLNLSGIAANAIHGNKSQSARQRALDDFKSDRTQVLVATDIASRGIDVEGISHVLNYDLPDEPETYVHRIGRTGRAGATGQAITLCDHDERQNLKAIERLIRQTLQIETDLPLGDLPKDSARLEIERRGEQPPRPPRIAAGTRQRRETHSQPHKAPADGKHGPLKKFGFGRRTAKKKNRAR
ncbi:MAG: DEAD/DEAH box helicase [Pirellulales bacterium]|nr:DEAD/DEAH box helicase [Pirellulales bacterium]